MSLSLYEASQEGNVELADPMNKRLFSLYGFPISTWPLSHFLLWLAATVMAPSSWSYYLVTGLVWEGVELLMKTMAKETTLSRTARTRVGETGEYTYLTYWEKGQLVVVGTTTTTTLASLFCSFTHEFTCFS